VVQVKISDKPKLSVSVVSLAGLAILKLVSWDDNSARRQKDASDLVFIVQNYLCSFCQLTAAVRLRRFAHYSPQTQVRGSIDDNRD
jgi:predicted nucleotidyltransferase